MKLLRTIISALCILAGALSIVGWAISSVAVRAVEDGTAVVTITERALDSEAVQSRIADAMTGEVGDWLAGRGVDLQGLGLSDVVGNLLRNVAGSDAFKTLVADQAEAARQQIAEALTDDSRAAAPLVVVVDVDSLVADQLNGVAVLGSVASAVDIAPVEVVVMDADTFERARTAYHVMELAAQYGLWMGIGLVVVGLLVSPRRAWFLPKLLLAIGVMAMVAWGLVRALGTDGVLALLPGGRDGALGTVVGGVLTDEASASLMQRTLWVGLGGLAGATVLALVVRALQGRR
ncbi:hypothetical protein RN607_05820 [Demequina capsici]|uniref:Uncharacterized protein n=1 Tax=Demequina capsici TaxID=3075620 RepID=A0AA96FCU1_9MICO|nr:hypothetical protein [Demequina sp. PMTSA13]WNM28521.1 hypothetical protein RN607_05820 [Demequina sp. PMTSA13]